MIRAPRDDKPVRLLWSVSCPKCGSQAGTLIEVYHGHTIRFDFDGQARSAEGSLHDGYPHHVDAECRCGNRWRLRGVRQIVDLDEE